MYCGLDIPEWFRGQPWSVVRTCCDKRSPWYIVLSTIAVSAFLLLNAFCSIFNFHVFSDPWSATFVKIDNYYQDILCCFQLYKHTTNFFLLWWHSEIVFSTFSLSNSKEKDELIKHWNIVIVVGVNLKKSESMRKNSKSWRMMFSGCGHISILASLPKRLPPTFCTFTLFYFGWN